MALFQKELTVIDGAYGTEFSKAGMPVGVCPEMWALNNPAVPASVVQAYEEAGASIILTPTLGGNPLKLAQYGLEKETMRLNRELAQICNNAVKNALLFGDISTSGKFVEPFGEVSFEDAIAHYSQQVEGLAAGGVKGFFIETMIDLQETRAAVLAARKTGLPVIVCMSFDENGYSLNGSDIISALCALQNLGICAFGCNCSVGPQKIAALIERCIPYARIPLCAKPNAGYPRLVDGKTKFDMSPDDFAQAMQQVVNAGASIVGGCCGSTPDHIRALKSLKAASCGIKKVKSLLLSGNRSYTTLGHDEPFRIIGERINPTGKKALQAELREGSFSIVRQFAAEQAAKGASILDVNVGMAGIDEASTMRKAVSLLSQISELPLAIDTTSPLVAQTGLQLYPGRALFNSISAEQERLEKVLPLVSQYGAAFIALPLDDKGIPQTALERMKCLERILKESDRYHLGAEDIIVDALVMTIGSDKNAAMLTLDFIAMCTNEGFATVCGLSNVSFGLPGRESVNAAFLSAAGGRGLTAAIANPSSDLIMKSIAALEKHKRSGDSK